MRSRGSQQSPARRRDCATAPAREPATYESSGYRAALAVLGNAAERDIRIVESLDD